MMKLLVIQQQETQGGACGLAGSKRSRESESQSTEPGRSEPIRAMGEGMSQSQGWGSESGNQSQLGEREEREGVSQSEPGNKGALRAEQDSWRESKG